MKQTFVAVTEYGTFKRKSAHAYTHCVVVCGPAVRYYAKSYPSGGPHVTEGLATGQTRLAAKDGGVWGFCSSLDRAEKMAREAREKMGYPVVLIVEVHPEAS